MPAVVEVQGVTKAYGEAEVLRGVDLTLREHEAIALIGASGSGKSTLLRCIDLLEEIDDGDVLLDGEVITDPAVDPVRVRRRLGMVFQAFNLFPHLTVLENVLLAPARAHGMARDQAGGPGSCSPALGSAGAKTTTRTGSREASSNEWPSSGRSPPSRAPSCSMRSPARWIPSWWAKCWRWCASSNRRA
jgi:ABC-type sugar transport system ATPase subunit